MQRRAVATLHFFHYRIVGPMLSTFFRKYLTVIGRGKRLNLRKKALSGGTHEDYTVHVHTPSILDVPAYVPTTISHPRVTVRTSTLHKFRLHLFGKPVLRKKVARPGGVDQFCSAPATGDRSRSIQ